MASRRVRIKGIANIPQRRKNNNPIEDSAQGSDNGQENTVTTTKTPDDNLKPENVQSKPEPTEPTPPATPETLTPSVPQHIKLSPSETPKPSILETLSPKSPKPHPPETFKPSPPESITPSPPEPTNPSSLNTIKPSPSESLNPCPPESSKAPPHESLKPPSETTQPSLVKKSDEISVPDVLNNTQKSKPLPDVVSKITRRRFIKPMVSVNAIRNKAKAEEEKQIENVEPKGEKCAEEVNISLNETVLPVCNGKKVEPLSVQPSNKVLGISKLPKPQYLDGTKSGSDTEYPPPPSSPNKFNRTRIKAVPRLGQRRTSFNIGSASESEDETRRTNYSRIRNDSVCSAASEVSQHSAVLEASQKKEFSTVIQRKCRRTEQSRKLAEARREFQLKFNDGKPDRQRLTMIDLIFYNPTTAPMSQKKCSRKFSETGPETGEETIIEDDPKPSETPSEKEPAAPASDEENAVPAPQITIGVNGEIIIDEQSLVIENKETIKNREALKQSEVVDGDFDTAYGVFKKAKRSKDWNKIETLRFYKALNTIGTDFTLMCELFPGRSRRELKMKFKKEERMNRALIDKAVMQPITFDLTDLRKEVELAQLEKIEMEKMKKEKEQLKEEVALKENGRKRKRGSMGAGIQTPKEKESEPVRKKRPVRQRKKVNYSQEFINGGINSLIDSDSDNSVSTIHTQTSETQKIEDETDTNLIPGSLMIQSEVNDDGETVNNIYTVDENGDKIQVELTPEILEFLTKTAEKNEKEILDNNNQTDSKDEGCKNGDTDCEKTEKIEKEILDNNNQSDAKDEDCRNGDKGCEEKTQMLSVNMSLSDSVLNPFLSDLDNSRILLGDNTLIIPFNEFDESAVAEEGESKLIIDEAK